MMLSMYLLPSSIVTLNRLPILYNLCYERIFLISLNRVQCFQHVSALNLHQGRILGLSNCGGEEHPDTER
jgi:hypothetical protein